QSLPRPIPPSHHLPIGRRPGPPCPYAQKQCVEIPHTRRIKNHKFNCHFPLNTEKKS
ncbi:peptide ABC transporter ATP-binding protein, partial [Vibrio parahaemolyticus]|nr:peptide ABC transporter ATP-binding protein [Vibrio parahaemolyticus]